MSRVHTTERSVHDGRKVRRGIFDGKSSDQLVGWSKKRKKSRRPDGAAVLFTRPPHSQSTCRSNPPARFSQKVRCRVRSTAAKTRIFDSSVPHRNRNVRDANSAQPSFFGSAFARATEAAENVTEISPAVAHTAPRAAAAWSLPLRNVRSSLESPNSNISDLEDEDSVTAGGAGDTLDADRLAIVVFPVAPLESRRFNDCFAIFAMRLRSMFSSGGNRRHKASPMVGSTSCDTEHGWFILVTYYDNSPTERCKLRELASNAVLQLL